MRKETDVKCPGCDGWVDPAIMNAGRIGIEIQRQSEGVSHSTNYCPACTGKMMAMDGETILDKIDKVIRDLINNQWEDQ